MEPSGPGIPVRMLREIERYVIERSTVISAFAAARRRAYSSSFSTGRPSGPRRVRHSSISSSMERVACMMSAMKPVPRSSVNVDMATLQPSPTWPTTFVSGMRTSS
ncbi:unannotated protein [freshwater metagenome]|uniref:Unannotated protein n=1 Tax=freshwater metagenome TaxID=449393 RepID=A0A6J7N2A8_9ZZZZ